MRCLTRVCAGGGDEFFTQNCRRCSCLLGPTNNNTSLSNVGYPVFHFCNFFPNNSSSSILVGSTYKWLTRRVGVLNHPDDEGHYRRGDKHEQYSVVERLREQDAKPLHGDLGERVGPVRLAQELHLKHTKNTGAPRRKKQDTKSAS